MVSRRRIHWERNLGQSNDEKSRKRKEKKATNLMEKSLCKLRTTIYGATGNQNRPRMLAIWLSLMSTLINR
jgi:hypothetical protein